MGCVRLLELVNEFMYVSESHRKNEEREREERLAKRIIDYLNLITEI
jgi:hypothetical protein